MEALRSPPTVLPTTFSGGEPLPTYDECNVILDHLDKMRSTAPTNMTDDVRAQRNELFCNYLVHTLDNARQRYSSAHGTVSRTTIRKWQMQNGWPTNAELKKRFVAAIARGLTKFREWGEFEFAPDLISNSFRFDPSESSVSPSTPSTLREYETPSSCPTEKYKLSLGLPLGSTLPVGIEQHIKGRSPTIEVDRRPSVGTWSLHAKSSGDDDNVEARPLDEYPENPPFQRNISSKLFSNCRLSPPSVDSSQDTMESRHSSDQSGILASYAISSQQVPKGWSDSFSDKDTNTCPLDSASNSLRRSNNFDQLAGPAVNVMSHSERFTFGRPPLNVLHDIVSSPLPLLRCPVCFQETRGNSESRLHQIECAIAAGCPVNSLDRGLTPLHALLQSSREEFSSLAEGPATTLRLARELLCGSPDPYALINALSSEGKTALYLAAERGHDLIVDVFLQICPKQARAMANVCDSRGVSVLMAVDSAFKIACRNGDEVLMNRCRSVRTLLTNYGGDYTVSENENWLMPTD